MTTTPPSPSGTPPRLSDSLFLDEDAAIDDARVLGYDPLLPPQILQMDFPLSQNAKQVVSKGRRQAAKALLGDDDRLV
ncbi:3-deoxy-7-phosphoheptulonate synthase, partial [Cladochytrium tenue]